MVVEAGEEVVEEVKRQADLVPIEDSTELDLQITKSMLQDLFNIDCAILTVSVLDQKALDQNQSLRLKTQ